MKCVDATCNLSFQTRLHRQQRFERIALRYANDVVSAERQNRVLELLNRAQDHYSKCYTNMRSYASNIRETRSAQSDDEHSVSGIVVLAFAERRWHHGRMIVLVVLVLMGAFIGAVAFAAVSRLSNSNGRPGSRFVFGTLVGLVIAGASLGSLVADEHKRVTSGIWLGVGLWITLVTTVRACVRAGGTAAPEIAEGSAREGAFR